MKTEFWQLQHTLENRDRRLQTAERRAAILVPIWVQDTELSLILTRRTETLSSHRGQVAFPGGGWERGDKDLIETALREAHEEVGLKAQDVKVLGYLDDIPTVTEETIVTPVVALVERAVTFVPNPDEVARVFTIPFTVLEDKTRWRVRTTEHRGRTYPIYYLDHDGETLWGLSAYVTRQLLQCMDRQPR